MGREQNFCEMSINMISLVTICVKHDFRQLKFSPFFVILSEKLANLIVIAEFKMGVNRNSMHRTKSNVKHDSVKCWKLLCEGEFSVNVNSLTHHTNIKTNYFACCNTYRIDEIVLKFFFFVKGCCQCPCSSHSKYLQCVIGMSNLLADICHHGCSNVCWKILQGKPISRSIGK